MRVRTIEIDEARCNGCGQCVSACHEGVIALVNGKAKVVRPDFCDGLGSCVPACPQGAIRIVEKAASACPHSTPQVSSRWPLKIALISPLHTFPENTLAVAADCTAFADPRFHERLLGRRVLITCPKFDAWEQHVEKLAEILHRNPIEDMEVFRMEVPCCFGVVRLAEEAIRRSGREISLRVTVVPVHARVEVQAQG